MDNFNELGNIWQTLKPDAKAENHLDKIDESILQKLKKTEKKHERINIVKTIAIVLITSAFSVSVLNRIELSLLLQIAIGWILFSLLIGMVVYWKKQYYAGQFEFSANSKSFIKSTVTKLKSQKTIITHLLPLMVSGMAIGINLLYFDLLAEESISFRVIAHISVTVMLYGVMYLGLIVRKRRFKNDFEPLIDELEAIYQNLKND